MKLKFLSFLFIFSFIINSIFSEDFNFSMFNEKLSINEQKTLLDGKMVIRNIDTKKNMCLKSVNDNTKKIFDGIKELNPNYTAEVIRIIKNDESRSISVCNQLTDILLKLEDYAGIPYFSERTQSYWDLYTSVVLKDKKIDGNTTKMKATYEMEPFGIFDCNIILSKDNNDLYYMSENLDKLRYYDKFTCVKPNNMHIYITSFECDGYTILYAIGGVDAPSIFFLRDRVETSFINRIKTFCQYMFEKIQ